MRLFIVISILVLSYFSPCFAKAFCEGTCSAGGGVDSLLALHGQRLKHKSSFRNRMDGKRETESQLVEKMSDEQLMRLIDHMFEASCIPADLWEQIMAETAKRNLNKINSEEITDFSAENSDRVLFVEKLEPDSISPYAATTGFHPASNFYPEWDEDLSNLFKDQFAADTTYRLELENSQFGCFKMPAWGPISSPFGLRHKRYHKGIDIQLRKGDTITAAFDGMVRFAQKKGGYGNVVIVRHYNGLETVYAHLSKIEVKEGQVISAGELVGLAGSTGHSTGPHLHFEMRFMGVPLDPQYILSLDYGSLLCNTVALQKQKCGLLSAYPPDTEFHTVKKGETIAEIANHYGTTIIKLRELNAMPPGQNARLKQGQTLRVRIVNCSESALSN